MQLRLGACEVRSWDVSDLASLVAHANNRNVWINLRDRFPYPYTAADGRSFIRMARRTEPETFFAIAVAGEAVGAIGYVLQHDVERVSAEIGYWLGEAWWGKGLVTEAVKAVTAYAVDRHGLSRVFAVPFAHNTASVRVLEKAGYVLEGRLRRSAIKDGHIIDQLQYAFNP
jgi:RimJ/RimL family protein N-acetyltransferase